MKVKPLWAIVALALLAAPLAADAQRAGRTPRVGMLYVGTLHGGNRCDEAFRAGEGKFDRLGELAAELVRLKVDVIFAPATMAALSAKHAKGTTPIVFAAAGDPIGSGRLPLARWVSKSTSWP